MISSLKLGAIFMIRLLFISPRLFVLIIREYCIINFLLGKKETISVNFNGTVLQGPNEHGFFYTAIEVFYFQLYIKLKGCTHIIDLGGYLGESAIWLGSYNDKVTVIEPNPSNFRFLNKNINLYNNIKSIHGAIVYHSNEQLYHQGGDFSAGGSITSKKTLIPIKSIHIDTIRSRDIDGIKMDIEGGEYDIINFLRTEKGLQLKKGYIEFHNIINNVIAIKEYIAYLLFHNYTAEYEDIYGKSIDNKIFFTKHIAVIHFYKK